MKTLLCFTGAIALHVVAAAGVVVLERSGAHLQARVQTIEVDDVPAPRVLVADEPVVVDHDVPVTRTPSRGASQARVIAIAKSEPTTHQDFVPEPPPDATIAKPHFAMLASQAGEGGRAPTTTTPTSTPTRIFSESEVTDRATLFAGTKPSYPDGALADRIELDEPLLFEIVVDTNGTVISATPKNHAGHGFDEVAIAALRRYRFTPAKRDGELVRVRMPWTVEFHLK